MQNIKEISDTLRGPKVNARRHFFLDYCFLYVVVPPKAAGAARREPMGRWVGCPNDR